MSATVSLAHAVGGFRLAVDFAIAEGGITALFGPSGAGKTTIVSAIAGLMRPRMGRIAIGGRTLLDTDARVFVPAQARRIGYVFQDGRLFPHMTVEANLRYGWRRSPVRADQKEFDAVVAMLGLAPLLARRPARLSGGEKGRVALGRALLSSPQLLLLDEPLAALDAARKAEILPYLERLRDQAHMPMLYVSHSLEEVTRLADRVILLKDGHVTAQGSVFDLLGDLEFSAGLGISAYGAAFAVEVLRHQADEGLTVLGFAGGELVVAHLERAVGSHLRVRLRAEDIMLAREEPRAISANNVLRATVTEIREAAGAQADVQLDCGGAKLVARITRASVRRLELAPDLAVFVIVKSVTVDPRILPAPEA